MPNIYQGKDTMIGVAFLVGIAVGITNAEHVPGPSISPRVHYPT